MTRKPRGAVGVLTVLLTAAAVALAAALAVAASGSVGTTADAVQATAAFHNLAVAEKSGYGLLKDKHGIACIAMPGMPNMAMGVHWAKPALVGDGKLKVTTPEALVYAPDHGTLRLAAVEYVVLKAAWDAQHVEAPVLFGQRFNYTPAGNRFGLPAYYSLHVWIWKHNPAGKFAMWNPEVHCQ
jgi:hypothetical protein